MKSLILWRYNKNIVIKRYGSGILKEEKTYDYVVVGAGSAGCVLSHYLREHGNEVALVEEGPNLDKNWYLDLKRRMPLMLGYNMFDKKVNYCYKTIPQINMNRREMYCPRGKVRGGSSSINGMVYVRGHPMDFDRWEKEGADGWSYSDCLPYFKLAENCHFDVNPDIRGRRGPLHLTRVDSSIESKLIQKFFQSCQSAGLPKSDDFNGISQYGYGYYDRTIYNQNRMDTYSAYLSKRHPIIYLSEIYQGIASKINFVKNEAESVSIRSKTHKNHHLELYAKKEIILCAGAINTPKLLMLSGIGDAGHLKSHNIDVIQHLPGVGNNLQDHLEFYMIHKTKSGDTLHSFSRNYLKQISQGIRWFTGFNSILGSAHLDSGAFTFTDKSVAHPDVQIHLFPYAVIDHGKVLPKFNCFQIHIGTLRAHSRGSVKLSSNNFLDDPLIDFNYLSDPRDMDDLVKCIDIGRNIFKQEPLKSISLQEFMPGDKCTSKEQKEQFIRQYAESAYHPSCTCKMGHDSDKMAVLDSDLKVKGVSKLRVVDASSFPSIVSGNLNASVIMLATKAARSILGLEHMKPEHYDNSSQTQSST